ncbi:MAG: WecB/TagA/CpsF family glycosyltransferase [Acidobacteria bacterium]|nr:WecB/TagA/CpsF family glycosyltransferase [Acidobacteriota bacterium]
MRSLGTTNTKTIASFRVLGVRVNAVQIPEAIEMFEEWIQERGSSHYVAVTGMHGVSEAQNNRHFHNVLEAADLVVPDGMPLVWLGRMHGLRSLLRRVYGPELMETFCRQTGAKYRHFFYGGAPGVADQLAKLEHERYGIQVAGTYSPPFGSLSAEQEAEVQSQIEAASPDILWVGLSTPKQELWMYEHRNVIRVPVMLGVGAAFDLNTGRLKQAPAWMRENGLEWLFRLLAEPRRLWRRYIIGGSNFLWNILLEFLGIKSFCLDGSSQQNQLQ